MPVDAQLLDIKIQWGHAVLWAVVETDNYEAFRWISMRATGSAFSAPGFQKHIATLQFPNGFVAHYFDEGEGNERLAK